MWLKPNGIANILYIKEVINRHGVTYKSDEDGGMFTVSYDRQNGILCNNRKVLYFQNTINRNIAMVSTVVENIEGFYKCQF